MSDRDDIDALAAEYALGTLDAPERADVAARRSLDAALDAAIVDWENRLAPLAETIAPIEAPAGAFERIEKAIRARGLSPTAEIVDIDRLRRGLRGWRIATLATGALAACLAVAVALGPLLRPPTGNFVAILQKDAASPAFLVSVDVDARVLTVRPVAAPPEPGKSYELWIVNARLAAPKSLGLLDSRDTSGHRAAGIDKAVIEDATYAVSLEPAGGSPTGAPTGPVLFTGKLVPSRL
jgi:anti-sigma-K factor RskA